jgi:hypothetical protein
MVFGRQGMQDQAMRPDLEELARMLSQDVMRDQILDRVAGYGIDDLVTVMQHAPELPQALLGLPIRVNVVRALGELGDPAGLGPLRECYRLHRAVEDLLVATFDQLPRRYMENTEIWGPVRVVGLRALRASAAYPEFESRLVGTYVAGSAEELAAQLRSWKPHDPLYKLFAFGYVVRLNIAASLKKFDVPDVRDLVLEILGVEGHQMVLSNAVCALARVRDARDIPALIGYLREKAGGALWLSPDDVHELVDALAGFEDESCRQALLEFHAGLPEKDYLRRSVGVRLGLEPEPKKRGLFRRKSKVPAPPEPVGQIAHTEPVQEMTSGEPVPRMGRPAPAGAEAATEPGGGRPTDRSGKAGAAFSPDALARIEEALATIETSVEIGPGTIKVSGAGSEGHLMTAADHLRSAHELHPDSVVLHVAYSSGLAVAAQNASARREMEALARSHPDFALARWALAGWDRWQSLFVLPAWGPATRSVHPAISKQLLGCALFAVRDGIVPRATLFFRDRGGDFTDLAALRGARIEVAMVVGRSTASAPVVGIYLRVWDNPDSPMTMESHGLPLYPRGHPMRRAYEHLVTQHDIDFAVVDARDQILLNRRLSLPARMVEAIDELAGLLSGDEEHAYQPGELQAAVSAHQAKYSAATVDY